MACFPSPGASSGGSPYSDFTSSSDFTSGSPAEYIDGLEPDSPFNPESLRAEFSVQRTTASPASQNVTLTEDIPENVTLSEDIVENVTLTEDILANVALKMVRQSEMTEFQPENIIYKKIHVGKEVGVLIHQLYVMSKYKKGSLGLLSRQSTSNSLTPYSDIAQPKKPSKGGTVKRPMNAFMVFAKMERRQLMLAQPELHNADISKHLGTVWKQCPDEVKEPYKEMAEWLKELHKQEHPEYKYRPRKRKSTETSAISEGPKQAKLPRKSSGSSKRSRGKTAGRSAQRGVVLGQCVSAQSSMETASPYVSAQSSLEHASYVNAQSSVPPPAPCTSARGSSVHTVPCASAQQSGVEPGPCDGNDLRATSGGCRGHYYGDVGSTLQACDDLWSDQYPSATEPDSMAVAGERVQPPPTLIKEEPNRGDFGGFGLEGSGDLFDGQEFLVGSCTEHTSGEIAEADLSEFDIGSYELLEGDQVYRALDGGNSLNLDNMLINNWHTSPPSEGLFWSENELETQSDEQTEKMLTVHSGRDT